MCLGTQDVQWERKGHLGLTWFEILEDLWANCFIRTIVLVLMTNCVIFQVVIANIKFSHIFISDILYDVNSLDICKETSSENVQLWKQIETCGCYKIID